MSDKTKALVVVGTLHKGYDFFGPFESVIEADTWAQARYRPLSYSIETLVLPEAIPAISDRSIPIPPDGLGGNPA